MNLSQLPPSIKRPSKRVGRGYGSGKGGHTSGRGQKGQNARGKMPTWFEGGQLPLIRRTPFIKGKSRFVSFKTRAYTIDISRLNKLNPSETVSADSLISTLKLPAFTAKSGIKLIGNSPLDHAFTVNVAASKGAIKSIETAGGKYIKKP